MDASRRSFVDMVWQNAAAILSDVATQAPSIWHHLPSDYPSRLRAPVAWGAPQGRSIRTHVHQGAPLTSNDLVEAIVSLIRAGLLLVEGVPIPGVTVSDMKVSLQGKEFVRHEEGLGPTIYWPGGENSGVTMGPGYDIGNRAPGDVIADLVSVGVGQATAAAVAKGAGSTGDQARDFVASHKSILRLSVVQQDQLFYKVVPNYESVVERTLPAEMRERVQQHEFDALLSLAWNTGRYGHYSFNKCVDHGDLIAAGPAILTLTRGGPGIPSRRRREKNLLEEGEYELKPMRLRDIDTEFYDDVQNAGIRHG